MSQIAQLGRTLLSPFTGTLGWYNRTAQSHPFATGFITTGLKTSAADLFAQKVVERREHVDWKRNAVFTSFGFVYLGAFQYYLYTNLFSRMAAPLTRRYGHWGSAPFKVFLDQAIHHPFVYFPFFFSLKTAFAGKPLTVAVDKWNAEIWDSCKALWSVWIPAQMVNFGVVPKHLRIPYVAAVSFGWTVILSVMQSKFDAALHKKAPEAAPAPAAALPAPAPVLPKLPAPALELCSLPAVPVPAVQASSRGAFLAAAVAEVPAGSSGARAAGVERT